MGKLKAGASKICITVPTELLPYPVPDWFGGGEYTGVKDEIYVRCLAISDGRITALMICAELGTYIDADSIRRRIEEELEVPAENILISATHSHEVPEGKIDPDIMGETTAQKHYTERERCIAKRAVAYNQFLEDRTVLAAKQAVLAMEPARYAYGEGKSYINCNRDQFLENGNSIQGLNYERPSDKTLSVIEFQNMDGKKIGFLINYAVHNNLCYRRTDGEGEGLLVYGDISSEVSKYVETYYQADGAVAVWSNGAAGNQNPYVSGNYTKFCTDGSIVENAYKLGNVWELCKFVGETQGRDVVSVIQKIRHYRSCAKIQTFYREYELQGTKVEGFTPEMIGNVNLVDNSKIYNIPMGKVPLSLMLITIGDIAVYGINGEVMCETGMRLKESSTLKHIIIVSYMGNNAAGKYMVDEWGYEHRTFAYYRNTIENGTAEKTMHKCLEEFLEKRFEEEE